MHSRYALDSDSSRWWWPQAAAGAVVAAAITAILIVPATGADRPGEVARPDPRFASVDPETARPCFMTRAQWNIATEPRCGGLAPADREEWGGGARRPNLRLP